MCAYVKFAGKILRTAQIKDEKKVSKYHRELAIDVRGGRELAHHIRFMAASKVIRTNECAAYHY